jgi:hypothetical protein
MEMDMGNSLFGEMSLRFGPQPENLATEALIYILKQHEGAWPALHRYFLRTNIVIPADVTFRSQAKGADLSQPDLLGSNEDGDPIVIIEAKFWAGLTPNQPVSYLRRLVQGKPGLLIVVCPGMRLATLWEKLALRCQEEGIHLDPLSDLDAEYRFAGLGDTHGLCITSWIALLNVLRREAEVSNHDMLLGDIKQLNGLCSRMDSVAFLPLHPRDISPEIGRRVQHYADLVDDVVTELEKHGADRKGLTTGGKQVTYARYFNFNGLGMGLAFSPRLWALYGETPIWLEIKEIIEKKWKLTRRVREGLDRLPPGKFRRVPESESPNTVGLELLLEAEKPDVIAAIVEQVKQVAQSIADTITEAMK